jgi:rubredoxin
MICGFCGHEFNENDGKKGCGGCPGGCHSVHCPRCNYKNPLETDLMRSIKKLFSKNADHKGDTQ